MIFSNILSTIDKELGEYDVTTNTIASFVLFNPIQIAISTPLTILKQEDILHTLSSDDLFHHRYGTIFARILYDESHVEYSDLIFKFRQIPRNIASFVIKRDYKLS